MKTPMINYTKAKIDIDGKGRKYKIKLYLSYNLQHKICTLNS